MPDWTRVDAPFGGTLSITFALIGLCTAISLVGFWALERDRYRPYFVFIPSRLRGAEGWIGALVSHFSHGDVGHLVLNMVALYFFGPEVEAELGAWPFLLLYGVSGAVGTLAVFLLRRKNPRHSALGASGAIAGVLFASVVISPDASIYLLMLPVRVPAPLFALLYLAFSSLKMGGRDGVAHEAHIGGALAGLGLAGVLYERGFAPLIETASQLLDGLT